MGTRKLTRRSRARGHKGRGFSGARPTSAEFDALAVPAPHLTAAGLPAGARGGLSGLTSLAGLKGLGLKGLVGLGGFGLALGAPAFAGPEGGVVTQGAAAIQRQGNQTIITQQTDRAALSWKNFDIGASEGVEFRQPSTSSIALNTINSRRPTQIQGSLTANGQVWLQNPNGILFGSNATVNVGGLLATSGQIDERAFAEGAGRVGVTGGQGAIINDGALIAGEGGVALVAPVVENHGSIETVGGNVDLAATDRFAIDFGGDGLLSIQVTAAEAEALALVQDGTIRAEGGVVRLTAAQAEAVRDSLVTVGGIVEATGIAEVGGEIIITGGEVTEITGELSAIQGDRGGRIEIQGGAVQGGAVQGGAVDLAEGARLDVSGPAGGGLIEIGRNPAPGPMVAAARTTAAAPDTAPTPPRRISVAKGATLAADATERGDGGTILFWSTERTVFSGHAEAAAFGVGDGGFVDISSAGELGFDGTVDLSAVDGTGGTLLFDPSILNIGTAATDDVLLDNDVPNMGEIEIGRSEPDATSTVSISTMGLEGFNDQGITITLSASRQINFNDQLDISGNDLVANQTRVDGDMSMPTDGITVAAPINVVGGSVELDGDRVTVDAPITATDGVDLTASFIDVNADLVALAGNLNLSATISAGSGLDGVPSAVTTATVDVAASINLTAGEVVIPMTGTPSITGGAVVVAAEDAVIIGADGMIDAAASVAITGGDVSVGSSIDIGAEVLPAGTLPRGGLTIAATGNPGAPMAMPPVPPVAGDVVIDAASVVAGAVDIDASGSVTILANTFDATASGGAGVTIDAVGTTSVNARGAAGTLNFTSNAGLSIDAPSATVQIGNIAGRVVNVGVDGAANVGASATPVGSLDVDAAIFRVGSAGSGDFDAFSSGAIDLTVPSLTVSGSLTLDGGGTMSPVTVSATALTAGSVTLDATTTATLQLTGAGVSTVGGSATVTGGGDAALALSGNASLDAASLLVSASASGSVSLMGDVSLTSTGSLTISGSVAALTQTSGSINLETLALDGVGTATVTISGASDFVVSGTAALTASNTRFSASLGAMGSINVRTLNLREGFTTADVDVTTVAGTTADFGTVSVSGSATVGASFTGAGGVTVTTGVDVTGDTASVTVNTSGGSVALGAVDVTGSSSAGVNLGPDSGASATAASIVATSDSATSVVLGDAGTVMVAGSVSASSNFGSATLTADPSAGMVSFGSATITGPGAGSGSATAVLTPEAGATIVAGSLTVQSASASVATIGDAGMVTVSGTVTVTGDSATLTAAPTAGMVTLGGVDVNGAGTGTAALGNTADVSVTGTLAVSGDEATLTAAPTSGTVMLGSATVAGPGAGSGTATAALTPGTGASVIAQSVTVQSASLTSATLGASGTVTVTGTVTVMGDTAVVVASPTTGTVMLGGVSVQGDDGTLTSIPAAGMVMLGSATVTGSGTATASLAPAAGASVSAASLGVTSSGTSSATLSGAGTVTVAGNATVSGTTSTLTASPATGTVTISGSANVIAGGTALLDLDPDTGGSVDLGSASVSGSVAQVFVTGSGSVSATGMVVVSGASSATLSASITGSVMLDEVDITASAAGGGALALITVTGAAPLQLTGTGTSSVDGGTGIGRVDLSGYTGTGSGLVASGSLSVSGDAGVDINDDLTVAGLLSATSNVIVVDGADSGPGAPVQDISVSAISNTSGSVALIATTGDASIELGTATLTASMDLTVVSDTAINIQRGAAAERGVLDVDGNLSLVGATASPNIRIGGNSATIAIDVDGMFDAGAGTSVVDITAESLSVGTGMGDGLALSGVEVFLSLETIDVAGDVTLSGTATAQFTLASPSAGATATVGGLSVSVSDPGESSAAVRNTGSATLVVNGDVDVSGGSAFVILSSATTTGPALSATGAVTVTGVDSASIDGTLVAGSLRVSGSVASATFETVDIAGSATLVGDSGATFVIDAPTVAGPATVGDLDVSTTGSGSSATVIVSGTAGLIVTGGTTVNTSSGTALVDLTTAGVANGPALDVGTDLSVTVGSGTARLDASSATVASGTFVTVGGNLGVTAGTGTATIDLSGASVSPGAGAVLAVSGDANLAVTAGSGTARFDLSSASVADGMVASVTGTLTVSATAGSAQIDLSNASATPGPVLDVGTDLTVSGTAIGLDASVSGSLAVSGTLSVVTGAILVEPSGGEVPPDLAIATIADTGGSVSLTATTGSVTIDLDGSSLAVTEALTLDAVGDVVVELGEATLSTGGNFAADSDSAILIQQGTASATGTLDIGGDIILTLNTATASATPGIAIGGNGSTVAITASGTLTAGNGQTDVAITAQSLNLGGATGLALSGTSVTLSLETVDITGSVALTGVSDATFELAATAATATASIGGLDVSVTGPGTAATAAVAVTGLAPLTVNGSVTVAGNSGTADIDLSSATADPALIATGNVVVSGAFVDIDGELTASGTVSATAPSIVVDDGSSAASISVASISDTGGSVDLQATAGSATVNLAGSDLTVDGTFTIAATSGSVGVAIGGQTLETSGTVSISSDTSIAIASSIGDTGTITVGGDLTLSGTPTSVTIGNAFGGGPVVTVTDSLSAGNALATVDVTAQSLTVGTAAGEGITLSGTSVDLATTAPAGAVVSGTISLTSSATATLTGNVSAGGVTIDAGDEILISGTTVVSTGAADLDADGNVTVRADSFAAAGINISATGNVSLSNDSGVAATVSATGAGGSLDISASGTVTVAAVGGSLGVTATQGATIDGSRVAMEAQLTASGGTVAITSDDDIVVGRTVPSAGPLTDTAGGIETQATGVAGNAIDLQAGGDLVVLGDLVAASGDISGAAAGTSTATVGTGNIFVEAARTVQGESVSFDAAADFVQGTVIGGVIPSTIISDGGAADGITITGENVRVFGTLLSSGTIDLTATDLVSGSVEIRPQQSGDTLFVDSVIPPGSGADTAILSAVGAVTITGPTVEVLSASVGSGALTVTATTIGIETSTVSATAAVDFTADEVIVSATAFTGAGIDITASGTATIDAGSFVNTGDTAVVITADGDVAFAPTTATVNGTLDVVSNAGTVFFAPVTAEVSGTGDLRLAGATAIRTTQPEGVGTSGTITIATTGNLTAEASGAGDDPTVALRPNGGALEVSVGGDLTVDANSGTVTIDMLADASATSSLTGAPLGVGGALDVTGGSVLIIDTDVAGTDVFDVGNGVTIDGGDVRISTLLQVASGTVAIGATGVGSGTSGTLEIGLPGPFGGPITDTGTVGGIAALDAGTAGIAIDLDAAGDLRLYGSATAESGDLNASATGSIFVEASREIRADSVDLFAADRFVQATIIGASDNATIISQGGAGDGITIEGLGVEIYGALVSSGSVTITNLAGAEARDLVIGPQPAGAVNAAGTNEGGGARFSFTTAPGTVGDISGGGTVDIDNLSTGSVTRIEGDVVTTGDLVIDAGEELRIGETRPVTLSGDTVLLSQSDLIFVGDATSTASATVVQATDTASMSATLTIRAPAVDIGANNRFVASIGSLELIGDGNPVVIGGLPDTATGMVSFDVATNGFETGTPRFGPDADGFASLTSEVGALTVQNIDTTGSGATGIGVLDLAPRSGSLLTSLAVATEGRVLIAGPIAGSDNADPTSATTQFSLAFGSEALGRIPSEILITSTTTGTGRIGVLATGELRPVNELTFLSTGDVTSETGLMDDSTFIAASGLATVDIDGRFVLENTTSDRVLITNEDGSQELVIRSEIVEGTEIRRLVRGEPSEGAVFDGGLRIEDASRVEVYGTVLGFDGAQAVGAVELSDSFAAEVVPEVGDGAASDPETATIGQVNDCDFNVACSFAPELPDMLALDTDEDTSGLLDVAGAAVDPIENDLSVVTAIDGVTFEETPQIPGPEGGVFVIGEGGQLEFRPQGMLDQLAQDETISFTVAVTVQDAGGDEATGDVTVTVTGINDAPVPLDEVNIDTNAANLSSSLFPTLIASDAEGDPIRFLQINGVVVTPNTPIPLANGGFIIVAPNGSIRFNPDGDFGEVPEDEIQSFRVPAFLTDDNAVNATAALTLTINVTGVNPDNQAPIGLGGSLTTEADMTSGVIFAGTIFSDPEMESLQLISIDGQGAMPGSMITLSDGGQLLVGDNGALSFDPSGDFTDLGVDDTESFTVDVTVSDPLNLQATAQLTITVLGVEPEGPVLGDFDLMPGDLFTTEDMSSSAFPLSGFGGDGLTVSTINGVAVMPGDSVPFSTGGALVLNSDGSLRFDPGDDFQSLGNGESRLLNFEVGLVDSTGALDSTQLVVTVGGLNDAPISISGEVTTSEDLPSEPIGPEGIAIDLEMDAVEITAIEGQEVMPGTDIVTGQGVVRIDGDGQLVFDPSGAFESLGVGEATDAFIEVTVTDAFGAVTTGVLRVTITGENDNPVPIPSRLDTDEDMPSPGLDPNLVAADPEMDALEIVAIEGQDPTTPVNLPGGGTLVVDSTGDLVFDPAGDFEALPPGQTGFSTAQVTVVDPQGGTVEATVTIGVLGVNDVPTPAPAPNPDTGPEVPTDQDLPSDPVPPEDVGVDPDANTDLTVIQIEGEDVMVGSVVDLGGGASVTLDENGELVFSPGTNFTSLAEGETQIVTLLVTLADESGATTTAPVSFVIVGVNDGPVFLVEAVATTEDVPSDGLLPDEIASDPENDAIALLRVGDEEIAPGGSIELPGGGVLRLTADGQIVFDPSENFEGLGEGQEQTDTIRITLTDSLGAETEGEIVLRVTGENDPPLTNNPMGTTTEDGPVSIFEVFDLATDIDMGDMLSILAINGEPLGTDGSVTLSDGSIVTIGPNGELGFEPGPGFQSLNEAGSSSVTLSIDVADSAGAVTTVALVVDITGLNDVPTAAGNGLLTTDQNTPGVLAPVEFVFDPDQGDVLGIVSVNGVLPGADGAVTLTDGSVISLAADGTITFVPGDEFRSLAEAQEGGLELVLRVADGAGAEADVPLSVRILGLNDIPVDSSATLQTVQTTPTGPVPLGDLIGDPDMGDLLSIVSADGMVPDADGGVTLADGSRIVIDASGNLVFEPSDSFLSVPEGEVEPVSLVLTVADASGAAAELSLVVDIQGINDAPAAVDDGTFTTSPFQIVVLDVLGNDLDVDGDALTITDVQVIAIDGVALASFGPTVGGGEFSTDADGNLIFDPAGDFGNLGLGESTTLTFLYTVEDTLGATDSAIASVTVSGSGFNLDGITDDNLQDAIESGAVPIALFDQANTQAGVEAADESAVSADVATFGFFNEITFIEPTLEEEEPVTNRADDEAWLFLGGTRAAPTEGDETSATTPGGTRGGPAEYEEEETAEGGEATTSE